MADCAEHALLLQLQPRCHIGNRKNREKMNKRNSSRRYPSLNPKNVPPRFRSFLGPDVQPRILDQALQRHPRSLHPSGGFHGMETPGSGPWRMAQAFDRAPIRTYINPACDNKKMPSNALAIGYHRPRGLHANARSPLVLLSTTSTQPPSRACSTRASTNSKITWPL
jgi:hypothetical protein